MTTDEIKQVCINELLSGESFLMTYRSELNELKNDIAFTNIIHTICKAVSSSVIFHSNANDPDHMQFKRKYLYDVFVNERLCDSFPAYQRIYNAIRAQRIRGLSAIISIFYGVVYLMADNRPQNSTSSTNPATSNESDLDYRKKWPAKYRCDDGHYVRSKNEQLVDNWLYHHQICHAYEVLVIDRKIGCEYISDFYLPHMDTYMEIWGFEAPDYLVRKKRKAAAYKDNGLKLIEMTDTEIKALDDYLRRVIL